MSMKLTTTDLVETRDRETLRQISIFVYSITEYISDDTLGWSWVSTADGSYFCHDCQVPLEENELAFHGSKFVPDGWLCLECAYDRAMSAGVKIPAFPLRRVTK